MTDSRPLAISLYAPPDSARSAPMRHSLSVTELIDTLTAEPIEVARKGDAPAWSPIAYRGARRVASEAESVCALVYDLDSDALEPSAIEALEARLQALGWRWVLHETYTSGRYRLALPLSADLAPRDYPRTWASVADRLSLPGLDKATGDLARLFYAPSCPPGESAERYAASGGGACLDPTALEIPPEKPPKILPVEILPSKNSPAEISPPFDAEVLRQYLRGGSSVRHKELLAASLGAHVPAPGTRDTTLTSWTAILAYAPENFGLTEDLAVAFLAPALHSMSEPEGYAHWEGSARSKWRSALRGAHAARAKAKAVSDYLTRGSPPPPPEPINAPLPPGEEWRARLQFHEDKHGNAKALKPLEANVLEVLRHDENFKGFIRFNVLRRRIEVIGGPLATAPTESLDVALAVWFQQSIYKCSVDRGRVAVVLLHVALENPVDPVQEYIFGLPKWDGKPRLDTVLLRLAGAVGNDAHIKRITRKFFISAIARAVKPGSQVDTVLVLQGAQGGGKTSFVRTMGAGFHVETKLDLHNKDAVMVATGNWLVELSELASLKRGDVESVRAFITTKEDQIRLPYGRTVESFPRRCVFLGTTNALQPLSDQEGNRRFWVVAVNDVDVEQLRRERDQLWAEAFHAYGQGETWWLTKSEAAVAEAEALAFTVEDAIQTAITGWVHDVGDKAPGFVSASYVCSKILLKPPGSVSNLDLQNAGRALRQLGWAKERRRVRGIPTYVYHLPGRSGKGAPAGEEAGEVLDED